MPGDLTIQHIRVPYRDGKDVFDLVNLTHKEPLSQFKAWFEEAVHCGLVYEANAMALATSTRSGIPSVRYVLLKELDEHGFYFFTNYESRKASELESNPNASLLFYWEPLQRQVRVEGTVTQLSPERSEIYFASRPKCSQLAATISPQSSVIPSRQYLDDKFSKLGAFYADKDTIPKPKNWGGYVLCPHTVEFWQGQTNRLHDRIRFRRVNIHDTIPVDPECTHTGDDGWVYERLAP
ncbi:hypothetical protein EG68_07661 [Paragonimus skrjabini miyazakii]|uniref:pyridoxal 5'-phosphate synthase n=1 Tax=Paragonimus skrjabini miyazakii TaxID=59628 RepID=A0A8S9YQQ0_9TREM|nr:hypothetical protein EG68_07661 [Paragonimus skrjabini miyazakii]